MVSGNPRSLNGRSHPEPVSDITQLGSFLASLQLGDSFFPSGLFTLSHGIESFAQAGLITPQSLAAIVADLIRASVGPSDAAGVAIAMRAAYAGDLDSVAQVDRRLTALKITRETRETSIRLGRQLLGLSRDVFESESSRTYLAIVNGRAAPGNQAIALALLKTSGFALRSASARCARQEADPAPALAIPVSASTAGGRRTR